MKKRICVVTPFFVDPFGSKRINYGDGFILGAIKRIIGGDYQYHYFSSRKNVDLSTINFINSNFDCIVLAGTNWIGAEFNIFMGLTFELCKKIVIPIVPFGVGRGDIENFDEISTNSKDILTYALRSSGIASVRCNETARIFNQANQNINVFTTGCPVLHAPIIASNSISNNDKILVSVTNRSGHYRNEIENLIRIRKAFPNNDLCIYFQQSRSIPNNKHNRNISIFRNNDELGFDQLIKVAEKLNFEIEIPNSTEECYALFDTCEFHIGTRLHVHLTYRAASRKSILLTVDNRAVDYKYTFGDPGVYDACLFNADMQFVIFSLRKQYTDMMEKFMTEFHGMLS